MNGITEQIWLTSALFDSEVPNVLTLGFSLKRSATSRKIAVLVSPSVSKELRKTLNCCFDFVFILQEDWNTIGLKNEFFVKLFALTLTNFRTCVMLSPNMMVLQNCDELFDWTVENGSQRHAWTKKQDLSVIVIQPSIHEFNSVMEELPDICENDACVIKKAFANMFEKDVRCLRYIDEKYSRYLTAEEGVLLGNEKDISIVRLPERFNADVSIDSLGIIGQLVLGLWKIIDADNVQPLLRALPMQLPNTKQLLASNNNEIAIVGMSCRYPRANNLEEFWNILLKGEDGTGTPPDFRWLNEDVSHPCKPEYRKTNAGFLGCPVGDFDSKFFNISPKELIGMDPQHRLLHELVWEGLEDAAIKPESLEGTNGGVFIGSWTNDYKDIMNNPGNEDFFRTYMGTSIGAGAARISHLLGLVGPSIATESGCSSAIVAVHLACKSLERRETNLALACGVNLLLHPFDNNYIPIVLAPDGHCKTFDAKADGFGRAEGAGVLILKRLSDAIRDRDNIWGVIKGSAMTQEGASKSLGTPTIHCESLAMKQALQNARVDPAQVSYVEAHGTGTVVGDPMEVAAIAKAYHSKERKEPLLIGSVKTNVGHTESCSGITGIMKVLLAMKHEIIPPHRNFETLNPAIDLEAVPAKIPLEPVPWLKQEGKSRLAGVSSFGITGTDSHVIIEEAPVVSASSLSVITMLERERPLNIMKITAKTEEALDILLDRFRNHLETCKDTLNHLAYSANVGRSDFSERAVVIAKSKEDAIMCIEQNKIMRGEETGKNSIGKVCFLFTGQGSQYAGMGKELYETSPVFRMHFEHCVKILKKNYNIDITQVLWSEDNSKSNEVSRTIYSQISIFCVEYALLKVWESWGIHPDYVIGHSLGEFAAAVCAGILNVEDALKLVAERSRLIEDLPHGKMLVIKAKKQRVDSLMKNHFAKSDKSKILEYAAINSVDQTVIAGDSNRIQEFSECCENAGLKCIMLKATHAFHSKDMDPILDAYRNVVKTVKNLRGNDCKYISGMRGNVVDAENVNVEYWVEHTREKVNFLDASKKAVDLGCRIFIEIGPQPVLSALTMMNSEEMQVLCLPSLKRNEGEWETLFNTLGKLYLKGKEINWNGIDQFCERKKVRLPHYPFIRNKFWVDSLSAKAKGSNIHPLLGSVLANASSTKIFQNGLNLRALEYVKDHAIGDNVIFPGACYLEMCLAAGLAAVEGSTDKLSSPSRAMKIENLEIKAPLCLSENKTRQAQTVVELNISNGSEWDWNDMKVTIFTRRETDNESTKWLPHAKAKFSPFPTAEEINIQFDIDAFTKTLEKPSNDEYISEIYDKLSSVGLKFGPSFRSLDKIWREEDEQGTLIAKVKVAPAQNSHQMYYIIHPIVLDAMLQSIMMLRFTSNISELKKKLYVPIKIGKFIWLSNPSINSINLYIRASTTTTTDLNTSSSSSSALLVDSTGKVLAVMSSVEFIDTTVKAIESVLEQQSNNSMPQLWEEVWKSQMGPLQHRIELSKTRANYLDLKIVPDDYNTPPVDLAELFSEIEKLVYLSMLRCLYEFGWEPFLGQTLNQDDIFDEFRIKDEFRQYFGFILEVFRNEGIFEKMKLSQNLRGGTVWRIVGMPPSWRETESLLQSSRFTSDLCSRFPTTPLLAKVGEKLSKILSGKEPALNILFPEEKEGYPSVAQFYTTYAQIFQVGEADMSKTERRFEHMRLQMGEERVVLRVLEIGAGTGSYTEMFVPILEKCGLEFEYTYTDISAAFFPAAEKKFEKELNAFKFRKLNIEVDPIEQGFAPEYFDVVIASDVIHATKDIKESLKNIRILLKPGGLLDIQEITKVHRFGTYLFGLLDGFWRFEDFDIRPIHCNLSKTEWPRVLSSSGFEIDGVFPTLNDHHSLIWAVKGDMEKLQTDVHKDSKSWLIFHQSNQIQVSTHLRKRLGATLRKVISIYGGKKFKMENGGGSFIIRENEEDDFQKLFKSLKSMKVDLEGIVYCWALNKGEEASSQEEILRPFFNLTKSMLKAALPCSPRLIGITNGAIPVGDIDLSKNFHSSTIWGFTKSLKNENNDMTLKLLDIEDGPLTQDQLEEIFYELWNFDKELMIAYRQGKRYYPKFTPHKPTNKNSLSLLPGSDRFQLLLPESKSISDLQFGTLDKTVLNEDQVEVQIRTSGLNFRDVLIVIKPTEQFANINTVGLDFAGIIKRVGEKVRKWRVGDRVIGCNTENSGFRSHLKLHQDYLLSLPQNMSFCEAATIPTVYITSVACLIETAQIKGGDVVLIHTATGGVGLSAIEICKHVGCTIIATAGSKRKQNYLRSLGIQSQHIFHSRNTQFGDDILRVTKGRGVDVVLNSLTSEGFKEATLKACAKGARFVEMSKLNIWKVEEVKKRRPDVKYTIVDVSSMDKSEWYRLLGVLRELIRKGVVKPLPYVRFDSLNIREALEYMQKAKHIGKIVCVMPEFRNVKGEMKVMTPMFNENSSYLITGGLGGIGFVICQWMVEKGAKHVLLAGRNPPNLSIENKIKEMNAKGANVHSVRVDIGNFSECKKLINNHIGEIKMPPLKGVMHAAGTLSDGLIINQTWSKLSSIFNSKVDGTLNLHKLTKNLNLEHFVVFSSVASLFGPPGQCNHAAGNNFVDTLIYYRNSVGLPGTTVNWGQWGEVGIATEVDLPGVKTISNLQGTTSLEYILKSQRVQLSVANFESFQMLSKLFPHLSVYLDEKVWKSSNASVSVAIKSDEFWQKYEDSKPEPDHKLSLLKEQIKNILRTVLKLDGSDNITEDGNFQEMGVDSLMFVEIKNHLQALLGSRVVVNPSAIKDSNTVNLLANTLVKVIEGHDEKRTPPSMEEVNTLIREDCILPDYVAAKAGEIAVKAKEIKRILLTGCTGTLGPYMLERLTNMSQISQVVCLMRPSKSVSMAERLEKVLEKKGLSSQVRIEKVRYVPGNVALSHVGLNIDLWDDLIENVDAVVHCAAHVDHTEYYRKKESKSDTRAVNIKGTKNILEFACEGKLKQVYVASSLISVHSVDEEGRISEDWPGPGDYDGLTTYAYPISKFVVDCLVKQAVERGIPCKALRLPFIVGESKNGRCEAENNHLLMRYMFMMKNGILPDVPFALTMLPVDICADLSLKIFFDENAVADVYNICHPQPDLDQEFVGVAKKFGYHVDIVDMSEFNKYVQNSTSTQGMDKTLAIFAEIYRDEETFMALFNSQVIRQWIEGNEKIFTSKKVSALFPNAYQNQPSTMEYVYMNLLFLKQRGVFDKFGL
ncbi:unnamed protein product [Orchesella dallaii]|uniref:Erythronolide synthase, modules 3 and 4 n=1 Tax=Orchesella dallaii TaxID=48710 RepID=A0ABP1RJ57_9HEXA